VTLCEMGSTFWLGDLLLQIHLRVLECVPK
jgi:hypothetical protein